MAGSQRVQILDENNLNWNAANPLPVESVSGGGPATANIAIYNKTMDTIGSFLANTFTSQVVGFTVSTVANTTTSSPPSFDIAMTSTGSPFFRVPQSASYNEIDLNLATNTIMYFSVSSQTNSTLQIFSREID
jgi:hypothetical protein